MLGDTPRPYDPVMERGWARMRERLTERDRRIEELEVELATERATNAGLREENMRLHRALHRVAPNLEVL